MPNGVTRFGSAALGAPQRGAAGGIAAWHRQRRSAQRRSRVRYAAGVRATGDARDLAPFLRFLRRRRARRADLCRTAHRYSAAWFAEQSFQQCAHSAINKESKEMTQE